MGQGQGQRRTWIHPGWARLPLNKQAHLELGAGPPLRHTHTHTSFVASLPGPGSATGNQRPRPRDTEPVFLPLRGKPQPGRAGRRGCCVQVQTREGPAQRRPSQGRERGNASRRPEKETFLLGPAPCCLTRPQGHILAGQPGSSPSSALSWCSSCQPLITFLLANQSLTWFSTCLKTPYLMDGVNSEC